VPWQKLLALGLPEVAGFERVVWVDSDIVMNASAPDVIEGVPEEKVGAVPDQALLAHPSMATVFNALNTEQGPDHSARARVRYRVNGLTEHDVLLNTGVMVCSPARHAALFEQVYRSYGEGPDSFVEQVPLSHEILSRDLHHPIDVRFNVLWIEYKFAVYQLLRAFPSLAPLCAANALLNSYFLHFAMNGEEIALIDPRVVLDWQTLSFPRELLDRVRGDLNRAEGH
jgi:hypothetical protein